MMTSATFSSNFFFFQAEDGIRAGHVTGVQTCALPISRQGVSVVLYPFQRIVQAPGDVARYVRTWADATQAVRMEKEIGRASCRERVYISVAGEFIRRTIIVFEILCLLSF